MKRFLKRIAFVFVIYATGPLLMAAYGDLNLDGDWTRASRESIGIAPDPATTQEAVVQVYAGRAFRWRGIFGVHTWIATKQRKARVFQVHQVIGWYAQGGGSSVVSSPDVPDRRWFGAKPELLADLRGAQAATAIPKILAAIASYPHTYKYAVWPGPNSNTFTAHIARVVPELVVDLPPTAIGKDYIAHGAVAATTPSGTGFQLSAFGAAGLLLALEEGVEVNLLGLTLGIDPLDLAIKLPGIGRIGVFD
jgi:hypothetical protein